MSVIKKKALPAIWASRDELNFNISIFYFLVFDILFNTAQSFKISIKLSDDAVEVVIMDTDFCSTRID